MSGAKNIFEWDHSKYTTHVGSMDKEHQVLVNLMNQLYQENEAQAGRTQLLKTVATLGQKTKEHFEHEEKYFSSLTGYAQAGSHKIIHQDLLKKFGDHVEKFKASQDNQLSNDFFMFLKVWLSAHICGIDRKYGEVAKSESA